MYLRIRLLRVFKGKRREYKKTQEFGNEFIKRLWISFGKTIKWGISNLQT